MNFSEITNINIPEGVVSKIATLEGVVLWEKDRLPKILVYETTDDTTVIVPNVEYLKNNTIISNTNYSGQKGKIIFQRGLTEIWQNAFLSQHELTYIEIPEGITKIGDDCFNATSLSSIYLPNTIESIGNRAFRRTSITEINMPNSVNYVGSALFYGCAKLSDVVLSNNLQTITDSMFYACIRLKSITIPNSVTSIMDGAFTGTSLETIKIPNSVISIGDCVFCGVSSLKTVTLSESLKTIGNYAFDGCNIQPSGDLTPLIIPKNVTDIGDYAFANNTSLRTITSLAMQAPNIKDNTFYCIAVDIPAKYCILKVPQGATGYDKWLKKLGQKWSIEYITE